MQTNPEKKERIHYMIKDFGFWLHLQRNLSIFDRLRGPIAFLDSEQPLVYKEKLDSNTYLHEKSQDDLRGGLEPFMNPSCQIDKNAKGFPSDLIVTSIVRCSRCTSYIAVGAPSRSASAQQRH